MVLVVPSFNVEKMNKKKTQRSEKPSVFQFRSILHLADDANSYPEICRNGGKITRVLFYERENDIIPITSNLLLLKCVVHFCQN